MIRGMIRFVIFFVGFTLPLESLAAFPIAGIIITPNKVSAAVLLFLGVLLWLSERRPLPGNPKNFWTLLLIFAVLIGMVRSVFQGAQIEGVASLAQRFAAVTLFYFLISYVITSRRELDLLFLSIILGCVFCTIAALLGVGYTTESFRGNRYSGFGADPNQFAFNLNLAIPMGFALYFSRRSQLRKIFYLGSVAVCFAGLVVALSRAAYVSLAGMWGLWLVLMRQLTLGRVVLPALVLAAGLGLFASQAFFDRLGSMSQEGYEESGSMQLRVVVAKNSLVAFATNPIAGVGFGQLPAWAFERDPRSGVHNVIHSAYLMVGAELGLMGLIPFIAMLTYAWRDYHRVWRASRAGPLREDAELRELGMRSALLEVAFFGVLIGSLFQPTINHKGLWLMLGLSTAVVEIARKRITEIQAVSPGADATDGEPQLIRFGTSGQLLGSGGR